ncbi:hypothetical protein [Leptospira ilyithenensis]|uniref:Tetratricopeptide repeat protein n=1 Tax=Leptospira ilyithenensis TaxID=2484901 RepID=A0A4R9LL96_9LEPT|nr:hypothetical protein [Leptospira ilyithenensis]TGN06924.1 hypothetical protein EHS11_17460 [Leptospira ilyithenensis]
MKKILCLLFFSVGIYANEAARYQKAYEMEKKSTLFAIPLYESSLQTAGSANLKKAAVSRLFFLYKKHNKIIEAILLGTRFSNIINSKEKASLWKSLTEIYRPLSYGELTAAYSLAIKTNPDNYSDLLQYLHSLNQPKLFEFVYIVLYKRKQYETLNLLFIQDHSLSKSPLYEGIVLLKLNPEQGKEFILSWGFGFDKDNPTKSDLLYLLGHYFRNTGDYDSSARYFRMSASFHWQERAKLEAAKSLVLGGKFSEACQSFSFTSSPNEEVGQLLYLICTKKDKDFLGEIRSSITALGAKEGGEFFQKVNQALEKW